MARKRKATRLLLRAQARQGLLREKAGRMHSLAEMLRQFDPARHGGEVMAWHPIGVEVHS